MVAPRISDQIGRVLGGRYTLVKAIGTGASAHVYTAEDSSLRRRVAVKILHPALADDESFLRRFRAEARTVAQLRHPGIMSVFDWGEDEDGPYLVMELLSGGSLRDMLAAGHRLTPAQAARIGVEAAKALDYAHKRDLVHRDIKPANLLFDDEGRLAIADFGLARALAEANWTEPAGAVLGTARYAAPEQVRQTRIDGKADVYALGLVLIEAVTGKVPFAADTIAGTLMARLEQELVLPEALGPLVPVIEAACERDPAERMTAGELAKALETIGRELGKPEPLPLNTTSALIDLTGLSGRERELDDVDDDITQLPPSSRRTDVTTATRLFDVEQVPPPKRRRKWILATLFGLLLIAGAAGAAWAALQAGVPTHPVPEVVGQTIDAAKDEVRDEEFGIALDEQQYSEDIPEGVIMSQRPAKGASLKEGRTIKVVTSKGPPPRAVPDIAAKPKPEAQALLEQAGFQVTYDGGVFSDTIPKDTVVEWKPRDGVHAKGSIVTVTLSKGKEPKPIPELIGKLFDEVLGGIKDIFAVEKREEFSSTVEKGQVIRTIPAEGTQLAPGEKLVVVVSKGPELVQVPNVVGKSESEAIEAIRAAGLVPGSRYGPANRAIFKTDPAAGEEVPKRTVVNYYT